MQNFIRLGKSRNVIMLILIWNVITKRWTWTSNIRLYKYKLGHESKQAGRCPDDWKWMVKHQNGRSKNLKMAHFVRLLSTTLVRSLRFKNIVIGRPFWYNWPSALAQDRPLSSFWTVHFRPSSLFSEKSNISVNHGICARIEHLYSV